MQALRGQPCHPLTPHPVPTIPGMSAKTECKLLMCEARGQTEQPVFVMGLTCLVPGCSPTDMRPDP
jgi:hypothetical protein